MHAAIGRVEDSADTSLQFEAQEVDFTQFFTGALTTASASGALLAGILYTMAF